eukprot:gb/GECG01003005.1/.p1 GENE.gb/GECG01003005.1/~~gb/GECG01003005.1/.p1  ORF type:complete len:460 (+),score=66.73 gb/GECG01003005.1/:1-1380(+)
MNPEQKYRQLDEIVGDLTRRQVYTSRNSERVKLDAKQVLHNLKHLYPQKGTYTTNDGRTLTLLKLEGVIPTEFRGTTYQTPIRVFLPAQYPHEPPICFVTPTEDLIVERSNPHVDEAGFITLNTLRDWNADCSLIFLIADMQSAFSQYPPLRRKPPIAHTRTTSASNSSLHSSPPVRPPRRNESRPIPSTSQDHTEPDFSGYVHVDPQNVEDGPSSSLSQQSWQLSRSSVHSQHGSPQTSASAGSSSLGRQSSEDPAEKAEAKRRVVRLLQDEMHSMLDEHRESIEEEQTQQSALLTEHRRLKAASEQLEGEVQGLEAYENRLAESKREMEQWIEENKDRTLDDVSVDKLATPTDELTQQLFELVSESAALDDAFYWMGRAAERKAISVEQFSKEARERGRREFHCRTLAKKIHDAMEADSVRSAPPVQCSRSGHAVSYSATSLEAHQFAYSQDVSMSL